VRFQTAKLTCILLQSLAVPRENYIVKITFDLKVTFAKNEIKRFKGLFFVSGGRMVFYCKNKKYGLKSMVFRLFLN
jgi:hypothetical protein